MNARRSERGTALLTAVILMAVLLFAVASLLSYAGRVHREAIRAARRQNRLSCAEAGLQLARRYYAANYSQWNTFFANPQIYNPVPAAWMTAAGLSPASPGTVGQAGNPLNNQPQLFADLDGDHQADVYIYLRDNQDELPPATDDWQRDNDGAAIVGAVCISKTMVPRLEDGQVDPSQLTSEALLIVNDVPARYRMGYGCGNGDGNLNNCT